MKLYSTINMVSRPW